MKSFSEIFSIIQTLILGRDLYSMIAQYIILVLLCVIGIIQNIRIRIGSFDAILVASYPRLVLGVIVCNGIFIPAYQLLLLIRPAESWWRLLCYIVAMVFVYAVSGIIISGVGWAIDGGKAIKVTTDRYSFTPPGFVDMTKDKGEVAQLIPRGTAFAMIIFLFLSILVSISKLIK